MKNETIIIQKVEGLKNITLPLVGLGLLILFWWLGFIFAGASRVPSPFHVFYQFISVMMHVQPLAAASNSTNYVPHLLYTIKMTLISTSVGICVGLIGGLYISWSPFAKKYFVGPLEILRLTPSLVIVPFLIMWFGISVWPQFGLVAFYAWVFFQVSTMNAITNIDPIYWNFAMTQGASRWQIYRKVVIPSILPELMGAARVVLGVAWGLEFLAEQIGAQQGMGRICSIMYALWRTDLIFVAIIWIIVIAVVIDQILFRAFRYLTRWTPN